MLIKITGIEDSTLGRFDAKELKGTRIDDGKDWSKKFFANDANLLGQLEPFGVGDNVNVKMKQDGKYWNIEGFTEASDAMIAKAQEQGGGYNKSSGSNSGGKDNSGGGGSKKGNWTPDPNKDRGVSLRYAIDTMPIMHKAADLQKMDNMTFTKNVQALMNIYVDLITGKDPFEIPVDDDFVSPEGDPLDPPTV